MKERLSEFLQRERLTAVKFAEIMEVQPSSISHLLSGRNKPNFDFISRILLRFPRLNPEWFINGIGDIYKSDNRTESNKDTNVNPHTITDVMQQKGHHQPPVSEEKQWDLQTDLIFEPAEPVAEPIDFKPEIQEITDVNIRRVDSKAIEEDAAPGRTVKSIERIVFFYDDGSFDEYHN